MYVPCIYPILYILDIHVFYGCEGLEFLLLWKLINGIIILSSALCVNIDLLIISVQR